jgi:hypothetical protein
MKTRSLFLGGMLALAALALAQNAGSESHSAGQTAADILRDVTQADGAFLAAGLIKPTFQKDDLATMLQYPDDEIVIVKLKGSDVRQAFERSISLYPQANTSFLQVSGFEITFDPKAAVSQRVKSITTPSGALENGRDYRIAMPSSLGRGGFGYFKIWDRAKIDSTLPMTVEKALAGKRALETRPRWIAQG